MALPKINSVVFETKIHGIDGIVKYRPFIMKEYKSLLQAREFNDDMRVC